MKEWAIYTAVLFMCISLQSVWATAAWVPPLWLIVLIFVATRKTLLPSLVFSYVAGFLWCVFMGIGIGLACTMTLLISATVGAAKHWIHFAPTKYFIAACAILGVVWQVLHIALSQILEPLPLHPSQGWSLISCLLITLCAGPMAYLLTQLSQNKEQDLSEVLL